VLGPEGRWVYFVDRASDPAAVRAVRAGGHGDANERLLCANCDEVGGCSDLLVSPLGGWAAWRSGRSEPTTRVAPADGSWLGTSWYVALDVTPWTWPLRFLSDSTLLVGFGIPELGYPNALARVRLGREGPEETRVLQDDDGE